MLLRHDPAAVYVDWVDEGNTSGRVLRRRKLSAEWTRHHRSTKLAER